MGTNYERFMEWLSAYALQGELEEYKFAYPYIEKYAQNKNMITGSLYEVSSSAVVKRIADSYGEERVTQKTDPKTWEMVRPIIDALQLFLRYTRKQEEKADYEKTKNQESESLLVTEEPGIEEETKEEEKTDEPVMEPEEKSISKSVVDSKEESISESVVDSEGENIGELVVDFNAEEDYSATKPVWASYFGEKFFEPVWRKLYLRICRNLYRDYPHVFKEIWREKVFPRVDAEGKKRYPGSMLRSTPSHRPLLDAERMKEYLVHHDEKTGKYCVAGSNAQTLLTSIKQLLDACQISYENLEIHYVKKEERPEETADFPHNPENSETDGDISDVNDTAAQSLPREEMRKGFLKWMKKLRYPETACNRYTSMIDTLDAFVHERRFAEESLYLSQGEKELLDVWDKIEHSASFNHLDRAQKYYGLTALIIYGEFLKTKEAAEVMSAALAVEDTSEKNTTAEENVAETSEEEDEKVYVQADEKESRVEQDETEETATENIEPENIEPENTEPENIEPENTEPENAEPENAETENAEAEYTDPESVKITASENDDVETVRRIKAEKIQTFARWMKKRQYAPLKCSGYQSAIDNIDAFALRTGLVDKSLYQIEDRSELLALWQKIESTEEIQNQKKRERFAEAIQEYAQILREEEQIPETIGDNADEEENVGVDVNPEKIAETIEEDNPEEEIEEVDANPEKIAETVGEDDAEEESAKVYKNPEEDAYGGKTSDKQDSLSDIRAQKIDGRRKALAAWMRRKTYSASEIGNCVKLLDEIDANAEKFGLESESVYLMDSTSRIRWWKNIVQLEVYQKLTSQKRRQILLTHMIYLHFLKTEDSMASVSENTDRKVLETKEERLHEESLTEEGKEESKKRQKVFTTWMRSQRYSFTLTYKYVSALSAMDEIAAGCGLIMKSVFLAENADELYEMWRKFKKIPKIDQLTYMEKQKYVVAVEKYADFLKVVLPEKKSFAETETGSKHEAQEIFTPAENTDSMDAEVLTDAGSKNAEITEPTEEENDKKETSEPGENTESNAVEGEDLEKEETEAAEAEKIVLRDFLPSGAKTETSTERSVSIIATEVSAAEPSVDIAPTKLDFFDVSLLEDTQPTGFSYFGEMQIQVSSWTDLYVRVVQCLLDDYPNILEAYKNHSISGQERHDFSDVVNIESLKAPRKVANDFYIETSISKMEIAEKIKQLLEQCNVDYENLDIYYRKIESAECQPGSTLRINNDTGNPIVESEKEKFADWMKEEFAEAAVHRYVSIIGQSSQTAQRCGFCDTDLFLLEDSGKLREIWSRLSDIPDFQELNLQQQNRFRSAIFKLIAYRSRLSGNTEYEQAEVQNPRVKIAAPFQRLENVSEETGNRYAQILTEYFGEDGYQIGRAIPRGRFKRFYEEKYGCALTEADERIDEIICMVGTKREDRVFPKQDAQQNDLVAQIVDDVVSTLDAGVSAVYIEAVYEKYRQPLADDLHIYNQDGLAFLLMAQANGRYLQRYSYLIRSCWTNVNVEEDLLRIMKAFHQPQDYRAIHEKAWFLPYDKMKHILVTTSSIVNVAAGTYFYAPNLPISTDELAHLSSLMNEELSYRSHLTDVQLMQIIREKCSDIATNTEGYTSYGLRNCLGYILRDHFAFNGPIITLKGKELSTADVYTEFAKDHEILTVDELSDMASEMNISIYWDSVLSEMIRVSATELIRKDQITFDIDVIDSILEGICPGNYIPLSEVNLFLSFPNVGYSWNSYLLESYLFSCSRKYRLLHGSFSKTGVFGAMVRMDAAIPDYRSLLVDVLSKSNALRSAKTALQYIVDKGYQQRRRYEDIEAVLQEARLIKEQREKQEK